MNPLAELNPEQRQAVEYVDGPALIFAGAGSGKTRVLTHKIAYLIKKKIVLPRHILAVTFTNKAADELRHRVRNFVGPQVYTANVGTFHSICARLLRREIEHLDYGSNFSIYDDKDQLALLKNIIKEKNIELNGIKPKSILNKISKLKNSMIFADKFKPRKFIPLEKYTQELYPLYQAELKKLNAVDFDDLLILPLILFDQHPELLDQYQKQFQYILVDEYQDTNRCQFLLIDRLGEAHGQVCVVGDDDQSIYSWRGADIGNILNFESVFPDCRIFKLEQNYRSTQNILSAASAVVQNNVHRAEKKLWSAATEGEKLVNIEARDEYDEARQIADQIQKEIIRSKYNFKDFALLYRTNAQSRILEQVLNRYNIPNTIIGGVRFYERKEIKDLLAYLRTFANPSDDISLKRIINTPPRGIGEKTFEALHNFAREKQLSLYESLAKIDFIELSTRAKRVLQDFYQLLRHYQELRAKVSLEEWIRMLIDGLELRRHLKESDNEEAKQRLANIDEFVNAIMDYCSTKEKPTLEGYLQEVSLIADIDTWDDKKNSVSLMTLHSAKGLEFPVIFICGVNEGLLPLGVNFADDDIAEERRLFYVGITRAQKKVVFSHSTQRNVRGDTILSSASQFLREIPEHLLTPQKQPSPRSYRNRKPVVKKDRTTRAGFNNKEPQTGKIVTHKIFGPGKIIAVSGFGKSAKLKIHFKSAGTKTIIAKYVDIH